MSAFFMGLMENVALVPTVFWRPSNYYSGGPWVSGPYHTPIDETTPNDSDFIYTTATGNATVVLTGSTPSSRNGAILSVRVCSLNASNTPTDPKSSSHKIQLQLGGTIYYEETINSEWTTVEIELTAVQAQALNLSNLLLRFRSTGQDNTHRTAVSWAQLGFIV